MHKLHIILERHHQIWIKLIDVVVLCNFLAVIIIPAKAFTRDYIITGVGLSVCLSVCYHDN